MQVQNFALARQEVVFDVEPVHGFEMTAQNGRRDQFGNGGRLAGAVFYGMQRLRPHLQVLPILRVPLRDSRVEIPAVVIKEWPASEFLNFGSRFAFEMREADYNIGNLDPSIIDVILHIDVAAGKAQQSNEGIPENRIPKMADVSGFIGINAGVLDENLSAGSIVSPVSILCQGRRHPSAIDPDVQISWRCDLHFGDAFDRTDL